MTPASWQPDPTGRHQFRWWDGSAWTDHVSSNGATSIDPLQPVAAPVAPVAPAVPPVAAGTPSWNNPSGAPLAPSYSTAQASSPQTSPQTSVLLATDPPSGGKPAWWKIAVPIAAVVALGAVLFVVIGGDDEASNPLGVTETELNQGDEVTSLQFSLRRGDVLRIRVEAEDADPRFAMVADKATSKAYGAAIFDLLTDAEFGDFFTDPDDLFTDADDLFSDADFGDLKDLARNPALADEDGSDGVAADIFAVLVDGTYTLIVGSEDGASVGKVRIIVERRDEKIDADTLDDFSALDDFFSDGDDDFFSDTDFFTDEEPFTPN